MSNIDILKKIGSIKSVLDGYRLFSDHVVKQLKDLVENLAK